VLRQLVNADPVSNYESARARHQPGTGYWFIDSKSYEDWLNNPKPFLWLHGKPGCGKTILSSAIIDLISGHCDKNEGYVLAYFYFSFTDGTKQTCENMLRSLIGQLATQVDITPKCLQFLHNSYLRSGRNPPSDALAKASKELIDTNLFRHVFVVIDALDEIPDIDEQEQACQILHDLSQRPRSHVLATSRNEKDIKDVMDEFQEIVTMSIQSDTVNMDILCYVREQLKNDKKLGNWPPEIRSKIEQNLSTQANGM
jgi:hypothetical protein